MERQAELNWLTAEQFAAACRRLGLEETDRQFRRWREVGLLKADQNPTYDDAGRVNGSKIFYPPDAPETARAISRAELGLRNLDKRGQVLWAAGYQMNQRFWSPHLYGVDRLIVKIVRRLRILGNRDSSKTIGDKAAELKVVSSPNTNAFKRLKPGQKPVLFNAGAEVLASQYDPQVSVDDQFPEDDTFLLATGTDAQADTPFPFRTELIPALRAISSTMSVPLGDLSESEIAIARDDIRNGLIYAVCIHEAGRWFLGSNPYGLNWISFLATRMPLNLISVFVLGFARLRRSDFQMKSSAEIAAMARGAEATWYASKHLNELQAAHPELRKMIGPNALKAAHPDSLNLWNLIKELRELGYPEPAFRPWDNWRGLAKKSMPPGLLMMGLKAPETVTLAELAKWVGEAIGDGNDQAAKPTFR